jgi:dihydrofolate synthase/folylpolyglutamate synthase
MKPYQYVLEYLYGLNRHGIKLGLDPTITLLKGLGNPHHRYVSLHIGGTNGKGSSAIMVATILHAAGYRVGLYTSPHLVDFRERIRVDGVMIPEERVIELTQRIQAVSGPMGSLTFFEFTTAMAFQYFAEEQIDVAVIEVGMGGRFDATNVLEPLGVCITNIACDHEQYLGNTLTSIAYEKAGIIKKGGSVIVGPMADAPRQVIESFAAEQRAVPYAWDTDFHTAHEPDQEFSYHGSHWSFSGLRCSLLGDHQRVNAACALALLEIGALKGLKVSESAIRQGLTEVRWEGRLETVSHRPWIVLDGAHNGAAAQVLVSFLSKVLQSEPSTKLILVVGMMRDKNHSAFLEVMNSLADHLILTQASLSRAASVQELREALSEDSCPVEAVASPREAIQVAKKLARATDLICITGSLILVGELRDCLLQSDYSSS